MSDYIRRQDAVDAFNRIKNTLKNPETAHYDTLMFYEIEDVLEDVEPADVVPICQTGCKGCKRENNLVVGSCRLCARFYKDMYEGINNGRIY